MGWGVELLNLIKKRFFSKYAKTFETGQESNLRIYEKGTIETEGFIIKSGELINAQTIEIVKLPKDNKQEGVFQHIQYS